VATRAGKQKYHDFLGLLFQAGYRSDLAGAVADTGRAGAAFKLKSRRYQRKGVKHDWCGRKIIDNSAHNPAPDLPNVKMVHMDIPDAAKLAPVAGFEHPPRILLMYGSLRERSFSRLLVEEAARLLQHMGAEVRIFNPHDLPMVGSVPETHPKVVELRESCLWSEGQVWCSPERHGAITAVLKNQIDWIPLEQGAIRPSQGRTLAVMQVCGGSQSFNTVNTLRCWDAGCACSRYRISHRCRKPMKNLMRPDA
jgi:arsenical resistance protein ArsH